MFVCEYQAITNSSRFVISIYNVLSNKYKQASVTNMATGIINKQFCYCYSEEKYINKCTESAPGSSRALMTVSFRSRDREPIQGGRMKDQCDTFSDRQNVWLRMKLFSDIYS